MAVPALTAHRRKTRYIWLILLSLSLYVVLPQLSSFKLSQHLLTSVAPGYVASALGFTGLTFLLAAATYNLLAQKPLQYHRTLIVSVANMFTNRLLPGGAGSIATFYIYLRRSKHSEGQAGSVVAVNNFLGIVAHLVILLVLFALAPMSFGGFKRPGMSVLPVLSTAVVLVAVIIFVVLKQSWHQKIYKILASLKKDLLYYARHPLRISGACISSLGLTLVNVAALWCCIAAVHASLSPIAALAVFTIGMLAGTVTPTPGGLGGSEAGLLAGLIGYHVASSQALAAVLLYRLITYWLTLVIGAATYVYVDHRGYLHKPRRGLT